MANKTHLVPAVALAVVHSKVVTLLLFIYIYCTTIVCEFFVCLFLAL